MKLLGCGGERERERWRVSVVEGAPRKLLGCGGERERERGGCQRCGQTKPVLVHCTPPNCASLAASAVSSAASCFVPRSACFSRSSSTFARTAAWFASPAAAAVLAWVRGKG
jgi:hypothetical protein